MQSYFSPVLPGLDGDFQCRQVAGDCRLERGHIGDGPRRRRGGFLRFGAEVKTLP